MSRDELSMKMRWFRAHETFGERNVHTGKGVYKKSNQYIEAAF